MSTAAILWGVFCGGAYFVAMWWIHGRRVARQRQWTRSLYALSESIVEAETPAAIAAALSARLPALLGASGAVLHLANRSARTLTRVPGAAGQRPVLLDAPEAGLPNVLAACARNRTPLSVPDTRKSSFLEQALDDLPRALLLIPLVSHEELLGVLEIDRADRAGAFPAEAQAAAQHLGNQIAAALKLQQQRTLQQQLHQGEALAATGQILTGIARELKTPLAAMLQAAAEAARILKRRDDIPAAEAHLSALAAEAARTQELVSRMLAFSGGGPSVPQTINMKALLERIVRSREPVWREQGLTTQVRIDAGPLQVIGIEPALEQLVLASLFEAEREAARQPARTLHVAFGELHNRARIEIGYALPAGQEHSMAGPSVSELTRGIAHSHRGEFKQYQRAGIFCYEITLPCVAAAPAEAPAPARANGRPLTVMLVDPEFASSRPLVKLLATRGHRVVPVAGEEAAEMAPRLRFDAVFWATRAGHSSWGEALEAVRSSIRSFVVVADGYNHELAASLEKSGAYLLSRPVEEASLDRILAAIGGAAR